MALKTTEKIMEMKAIADMCSYGRSGERAAFWCGYLYGKIGTNKGVEYHFGGRCFHAYKHGRQWGEAVKREMRRDAILKEMRHGLH